MILGALVMVSSSLYGQLRLNSSGKVGIAGSSPSNSYGLLVNGKIGSSSIGLTSTDYLAKTIKFYGGSGETTWNVTLSSNVSGELHINGAKITTTSDARLKNDNGKIQNASDKLRMLVGHSYYFKSPEELQGINLNGTQKYGIDTILAGGRSVIVDESLQKFAFSKKLQYGFMAQEVEQNFPELVSFDSLTGTYGVDYMSVIPILVEANKELLDQQKTYERKLAELEERLLTLTGDNDKPGQSDLIKKAQLLQNSPNPFNRETTIRFSLPESVKDAQLYIYNLQGRQVKSVYISDRGDSELSILANELAAGMYLYSLVADGVEIATKKMILTE